ncbi:MAG: hypothetical protein EOP49_05845, partial [Sphingobacteriales bacterium]
MKIFLRKKLICFVVPAFIIMLLASPAYSQTTKTFTSSGSFTVPAGVTSITIEAWGSGGAGGSVNGNNNRTKTGGGGGGGAYASKSLAVVPGTLYQVTVGAAKPSTLNSTTAADNNGNASIFSRNGVEIVKAMGGAGGAGYTANSTGNGSGAAGSLPGSIGDATKNGGAGGTGNGASSGAGGGSGGSSGLGGNASAGTAGAAGLGGGAPGGTGVSTGAVGNSGGNYGGGGSGGRSTNNSNFIGGSGAQGFVQVTYTCPIYGFSTITVTNSCVNNPALVTLTGTASTLPVGTYTVTYNLSGGTTITNKTETMSVTTAGTGSFSTANLVTANSTTVTVTSIAIDNCITNMTTGNAVSFNVTPAATLSLSSTAATTSQSVCLNAAIQNIVYTIGGSASGVSVTGLPAGLTGVVSGSTLTVSGTPTEPGVFAYTVRAAGACNSNPSLSGTITVNAPVITLAATAAAKCSSATAQTTTLAYTATWGSPTSYSITWSNTPANSFANVVNAAFSGSSGNFTINIPAATPAGTYTGYLTVRNATTCNSLTYTFTLTINPLPTPFKLTGPNGEEAEFCTNGSPATFTLGGSEVGVNYTFTPINNGGNVPQGHVITVPGGGGTISFTQTPNGNWVYEVVGENPTTGCKATMDGTLKPVDGPAITLQPQASIVECVGNGPKTIRLEANNATSLQWQISTNGGTSWENILPANTNFTPTYANNKSWASLRIADYTTAMTGYRFRVVLGGPSACPINYSAETVLNISAPPVFVTEPLAKSVCPNSTLILTAAANYASTYQWYKNNVAIPNAQSPTYSVVFNAGVHDGNYYVKATGTCGAVNSSVVVISVNNTPTATTWQGPTAFSQPGTGTAWEVEANWSCGLPNSTRDAIIPADIMDGYPTIKPAITGEVKNLTIHGGGFGAFLAVQGHLRVFGTVSNSGGVFDLSEGTIEFSGNTPQTIPTSLFTSNNVLNMVISNNVNLAGPLNITGTLSFGNVNNKTFATGEYLSIKSGLERTAKIADLTNNTVNTGNSITGNVTVERFIPSQRRYRLLTSPVKNTSINSAWQEGRSWNGQGTEAGGWGTLITGTNQGTAANANSNGFDFWSPTSTVSVFRYSGSFSLSSNLGATWAGVSSTKAVGFDNNEAYLLFVRGDRTVTANAGATTLRGKGKLKEEPSHPITVFNQSHTLIGNPFASPLNFAKVYADNSATIEPFYWIWQASLGTGTGGYVLVQPNGSGGYEAIPSINPGASTEPVIGSGEGFFVVPKAGASLPATITIQQKHKATGLPMVAALRAADVAPANVRINLFAQINEEKILLDGVLARFSETKKTNLSKASNSSENLSIFKNSKDLIVAGDALPQDGDSIQLRFWNLAVRKYTLELAANRFPAGTTAVLYDRHLAKETPIQLSSEGLVYEFAVTADAGSKNTQRFVIRFQKSQVVLPVTLLDFTAKDESNSTVGI